MCSNYLDISFKMIRITISLLICVTLGIVSTTKTGRFNEVITNNLINEDRNAIIDVAKLWPNHTIPYTIDPSLSSQKELIEEAIEEYNKKTCIAFHERKSEDNYVEFKKFYGCSSLIGMQGGAEIVSIVEECFNKQSIMHLLGHIVGFSDEHNRSDRDDYLTIYWDNVDIEHLRNFDKLRPWENNLLDEPFDFDSIMLLDNYAFSKEEGLKTMESKTGEELIPFSEKKGLSEGDVRKIEKLYECSGYVRPTLPGRADYYCDFEEDTCGIAVANKAGWARSQISFGLRISYAMIFLANEESNGAGIQFPDFEVSGSQQGCLSLKLYMDGEGIDALHFYQHDNDFRRIKLYNKKSESWQDISMDLTFSGEFVQIYIYAYTMSNSKDGVAAIDDFKLSANPC